MSPEKDAAKDRAREAFASWLATLPSTITTGYPSRTEAFLAGARWFAEEAQRA